MVTTRATTGTVTAVASRGRTLKTERSILSTLAALFGYGMSQKNFVGPPSTRSMPSKAAISKADVSHTIRNCCQNDARHNMVAVWDACGYLTP